MKTTTTQKALEALTKLSNELGVHIKHGQSSEGYTTYGVEWGNYLLMFSDKNGKAHNITIARGGFGYHPIGLIEGITYMKWEYRFNKAV